MSMAKANNRTEMELKNSDELVDVSLSDSPDIKEMSIARTFTEDINAIHSSDSSM